MKIRTLLIKLHRVFQSTALQKLLDWGERSLEMSINQPTLPHAIIAVNATEIGVRMSEWEVESATTSLLSAVQNSLRPATAVPEFVQLANKWRERGRRVETVLDLIRCYYSSFSVVRIPEKGRYGLLNDQVRKLHKRISDCCKTSYNTKRTARMLLSAEALNVYFQAAFDHFSQQLDRPFNFVEVSLRNNPIPLDFGGHILQLANSELTLTGAKSGPLIFQHLSYMVASAVLLEVVRNTKGSSKDSFKPIKTNMLIGWAVDILHEYQGFFLSALDEFCFMYWPCTFSNSKGRCVNVSNIHNPKGHQNAKGRIIAVGGYESEGFSTEDFGALWISFIQDHLSEFQKELKALIDRPHQESEQDMMWKLHKRHMAGFYAGAAPSYISHSTCFSCLMAVPEHVLPCGHVLCSRCIKNHGKQRSSKVVLEVSSCPLHEAETQWQSPWVIRFKPDFAGVRLLCLDGYVRLTFPKLRH